MRFIKYRSRFPSPHRTAREGAEPHGWLVEGLEKGRSYHTIGEAGREPVDAPAPVTPHTLAPTGARAQAQSQDRQGPEPYLGEKAAAGTRTLAQRCQGPCSQHRSSPRLVLRAAACTRRRAALTLCHGTAIRHGSQINSRPVQENRQLSTGDNAAFVLRLEVQGQLPVLHCGR